MVQNLDKIRFPHINVGSEAITPLLQAIKAAQGPITSPAPAAPAAPTAPAAPPVVPQPEVSVPQQ
jgi:hypothetical protein